MRRALNLVLVIIGISASVMASPRKSVTTNDGFRNVAVIEGFHVSLPTDMKSFPVGAIPLP